MSADRRKHVEELVRAARECPPEQRHDFVRSLCGNDEELRQEVDALLARSDATEGSLREGSMVGHYRIVRVLGEGGMGAVYEAEQEQPRRRVALKVIRPGLVSAETLQRFSHETQALGRLQHPGIAHIYEGGTADTGLGPQPFIAMELITGRPIGEYCADRSTRERLEVMRHVCEAVQHAHQRGLIHRDLKPANILVEDTGQPKILDFGLARPVGFGDEQETTLTDLGKLVGTLAYMSPEQAQGDPLEVDARSDVYALGIILYELLAEQLPYAVNSRRLHEAILAIREQDPKPLSSYSRTYRGDIETIVAKAIEKSKERRYGSAGELAADIRRYLTDQPIVARPQSRSYQLGKFVRRHRALVSSVAAVFAALVAGMVATSLQTARARRAEATALEERDRADDQASRARVAGDAAIRERDRADAQARAARSAEDTAISERDRADDHARAAERRRRLAAARFLAGEGQSLLDSREAADNLGTRLLHAAMLGVESLREEATPQGVAILHRALRHLPRPLRFFDTFDGALVDLSADGRVLAFSTPDSRIQVWDVVSGRRLNTIDVPTGQRLDGPSGLAVSGDGSRLAWTIEADTPPNHVATIVDVSKGRAMVRILMPASPEIALNFEGTLLAASEGSGSVGVWDAVTAALRARWPARTNVCNLRFADMGRAIQFVSCRDRRLQRRQLSSGDPLDAVATTLTGVEGGTNRRVVDVAAEGTLTATSDDSGTVQVWDAAGGSELWRVEHGGRPVQALRLSTNGSTLAAVSRNGRLGVWTLESSAMTPIPGPGTPPIKDPSGAVALSRDGATLVRAIGGVAEVVTVGTVQPVARVRTRVSAMLLAANRDGKRLAVSNGFTDTSVWDQATGAEIGSVATRPEAFAGIINSVALSGDGRRLALGGDFESLAVFDVVTGRTLFSPRPNPNRRVSGAPLAFALDDTGHRVAVAAENSTLTVYDVDSGRSLATRALSERAVVLAFSADSRLLATESADRVLQVWNGNTIEELARIPHTFDVVGLSLSDERLRVLRPDGSMVDVVWEPGRLIRAACTAIGRNFSPAEWVRYFSDETHRKTCAQL